MHRSALGIRPGVTVTRTTGAWQDIASSAGRPRPAREEARWRGRSAVPAVVAGVLLSQVVAYVVANAAGRGAVGAPRPGLAHPLPLPIRLVVAPRGGGRPGPATVRHPPTPL